MHMWLFYLLNEKKKAEKDMYWKREESPPLFTCEFIQLSIFWLEQGVIYIYRERERERERERGGGRGSVRSAPLCGEE